MRMRHFPFSMFVMGALWACSPTFNWREVRIDNTALAAMLPCKPDSGSRTVALGGRDTEMHMVGCDAGDATFAVAWVDAKDPAAAAAVVAQWQQAMLANMRAEATQNVGGWSPKGALATPPAVLITAQGRRQDGRAVAAQGGWFVGGSKVFHAVVYADKLGAPMTDSFFSGLVLQ